MKPVVLAKSVEESVYGGKAAQLAAAIRAGLPVPGGVALSFGFVDAVSAGHPTAIRELAEAEGESAIYRDLRMKLFIHPDSMKARYAASPPWLKALMDAWADGLNYYLHTHPTVRPGDHARPAWALPAASPGPSSAARATSSSSTAGSTAASRGNRTHDLPIDAFGSRSP